MSDLPLAITRCAVLTPLDTPSLRADPAGPPNRTGTWESLLAGKDVCADPRVSSALLEGDTSLDRSIRLALTAINRIRAPREDYSRTALFCGTSKGPVLTLLSALDHLREQRPPTKSQAWHVATGVGAMSAALSREINVGAGAFTSVAACASGMFALHNAAQALRRGECDLALVIAADASLHPLFESSFARLGVLSPADALGIRRCTPFDAQGRGFFLSEAAAALLIERNPPRGQTLASLEATWTGADSTALLAIDNKTQTLRHGIAQLAPHDAPAFIHAHATGTDHDQYELAAIRATLGNHYPPEKILSHKKQLGHSLGAAGLVAVAISTLSHFHRKTFTGIPIPKNSSSLTIAQGFGGHIALARLRGTT